MYNILIIKGKEVTIMLNDIVSVISTLGFPIAMCLILCYYVNKINESHQAESKEFADALNNNTIVLQKLCDKLDVERNDEIDN